MSVAEAARKAARDKEEEEESESSEEEARTRRRAHGRRASIVGRPGGAAAQAPAKTAAGAPSSPKLEPKKRVYVMLYRHSCIWWCYERLFHVIE